MSGGHRRQALDGSTGRPPSPTGETVGPSGTPFAVELTADRQSRVTFAVLLAGPVIWLVHFMVVYLVAEAGCTGGGPGLELLDPPVPSVVTVIATVVAAGGCVATTVWGHRRWRGGEEPLALVGALLSGLFGVTVVMVGLSAIVFRSC
jgi:hypothetical protein